jgi:predicted nuclease of predicted toxin-antitoxin system
VKLLFDQNLSPRLVNRLADLYPDSSHVYLIGLDTSPDSIIWQYALENEFIIVTRDADFSDLNVMLGFPPKVIWIRRGNCTTGEIELILRSNHAIIKSLVEDESVGILTLF